MKRQSPGDLLWGRYRLQTELGAGTLTSTWIVRDEVTGGEAVLKLLELREAGRWKVVELFEREAAILRRLDHPAIPRYLDARSEESDGNVRLALVQERIPGTDLAARLAAGQRFTESDLRSIARQTLEVLCYLHSRTPPVLHRDIKPSNLILDPAGKLSLVDFGAAAEAIRCTGAGGSVVGTYGYMPPEQFLGRAVPATDLYGLGCTLVHLATGTHPAQLPVRELKADFRPWAWISAGLADLIERLIDPDLETRPGDATAVLALLEQVPASAGTSEELIPNPLAGGRVRMRRILRTGAEALVMTIPGGWPAPDLPGLAAVLFTLAALCAILISLTVPTLTPGGLPAGWGSWMAGSAVACLLAGLLLTRSCRHRGVTELRAEDAMLWVEYRYGPIREQRRFSRSSLKLELGAEVLTLRGRGGRRIALGAGLDLIELEWVRDRLAYWQAQQAELGA